jgi:hypothetical protein
MCRRELISDALKRRFGELQRRLSTLVPERFGEMSSFVALAREKLQDASPVDLKNSLLVVGAPGAWMASDEDCLSALRRLSLGETFAFRHSQAPPLSPFLQNLSSAQGREPEGRFRLLAERYACPLNFALPSEDEARERVLTRLMSQDRARLEKSSPEAVNSDDLLLRLNLVAVQASLAPDLRFLDALNYYYELLPPSWQPRAQHDWLLVSYVALYARAQAVWISGR